MPKVSELQSTPALAPGDLVYVVADGVSSKLASLRVANIAAMQAILVPTNGMSVEVTEAGRGGLFVFDTSLTASADDGTTFKATDATTGSWARRYSGPLLLEWFGAVPDDATGAVATANTTVINSALTAIGNSLSKTVHITNRFYVAGTINVPASVHSIVGDTARRCGFFQITASTTTLAILGGSGNQTRLENFSVVDTNFVLGTTVYTSMTHKGIDINATGTAPLSSCYIKNLYVEGFGIGINNPGSFVCTYQSVRLKNCRLGILSGSTAGGSTTQLLIQCWADTCLSGFVLRSTESTLTACVWDFNEQCLKGAVLETEGLNGWFDLTGVSSVNSTTITDFAYESYGLDPFELDAATTYPSATATWAVGATANVFNLFLITGGGNNRTYINGLKFVGIRNTVAGDEINLLKIANINAATNVTIENVVFDYFDANAGADADLYVLNAASGGSFNPTRAVANIGNISYGTNGTLTNAGNTGASLVGIIVARELGGSFKKSTGALTFETKARTQVFNANAATTLTLPLASAVPAYEIYELIPVGDPLVLNDFTLALSGADTFAAGAVTTMNGPNQILRVFSNGVSVWFAIL